MTFPTLVRNEANPVLSPTGVPGDWMETQLLDQIVQVDPSDPTQLVMYFGGATGGGATPSHGAIGRATAAVGAPAVWTLDAASPVLLPGTGGDWDYAPNGIRLNGAFYVAGTWRLYYSVTTGPGIGLATSTDGVTFTKDAGNPIIPKLGDESWQEMFEVFHDPDDESYPWKALYLPGNHDYYRSAKSPDGLTWTLDGVNVLARTDVPGSPQYIEAHHVYKLGSWYYMVMECGFPYLSSTRWGIAVCRSADGLTNWIFAPDQPMLAGSFVSGAFDEFHAATPSLCQINGQWHLFYQGGDNDADYTNSIWKIGMAAFGQWSVADAFPGTQRHSAPPYRRH